MKAATSEYQRLGGRLPRSGGKRAWLSRDHLLVVSNGLFNERYTRLYWGDIQSIILYALQPPNRWLLALEGLCIAAPLTVAAFAGSLAAWAIAFAFALAYGTWRITRFRWACLILTRTSGARLPIAISLPAAHAIVAELRERVSSAQGTIEFPAEQEPLLKISPRPVLAPKKPFVLLHGVVFGLGIVWQTWRWLYPDRSGLQIAFLFAILHNMGLLAIYFLQADFEFPFAVRSAAVMSQLFVWDTLLARVIWRFRAETLPYFGFAQVLFGLYGLVALYEWSLQRQEPKPPVRATLLGLS